jgi:hypothetical protein
MVSELAQACLDKIRRDRYVSFVELARLLEERGVNAAGEVSMQNAARPNLVLWAGMSEEFYACVDELLSSKLVELVPASPLSYLVDGGMLDLPLARRVPKAGYKEPHWACAVFNPVAVG